MPISLFIPVYNEEKILKDHLDLIYDYLEKNMDFFELIIVDDSSIDNTPNILNKLQKQKPFLKYIRFDNGPSRRENLGRAIMIAKYPLIGYMDFDLAIPLHYLSNLIQSIDEGYDIAVGSRRVKGAKVNRSLYRLVLSTLYHTAIKIVFNSKIKDYQCGFKLFRKEALIKIIRKIGYDKSFRRGWFWDAELMITAEKMNYKIKEIPVSWKEGKKSSFNLFRELKVLPYMFKFRSQKFSL